MAPHLSCFILLHIKVTLFQFYSASDTVLLVQIDQTDESEEIIFVHESLNASNIVGMNVDFSSTSCSGKVLLNQTFRFINQQKSY